MYKKIWSNRPLNTIKSIFLPKTIFPYERVGKTWPTNQTRKSGFGGFEVHGKVGSSNVVLRIRWISPTRGPILESVRKTTLCIHETHICSPIHRGMQWGCWHPKRPTHNKWAPCEGPTHKKAHTNPQPSPPTAHLSRKGVGIRKAVWSAPQQWQL